jgi:hypothetical protein
MRQNATNGSSRQNIGFFLILGAFVLVIISLSRNLVNLLSVHGRVSTEQQELEELKSKNSELHTQANDILSGNKDEEFIRNNLIQVKGDQSLVIIPDELLSSSNSGTALLAEPKKVAKNPTWKRWFELIL